MKIKTCSTCKWSVAEPRFPSNLLCVNPEVNRKDPFFLGSGERAGSYCVDEREKIWPRGVCGLRGAKYEQGDAIATTKAEALAPKAKPATKRARA